MPEFAVKSVSDEAMGEREWMVLLVRETGQVILAVKRTAELAVEEWALAMRAVDTAYASSLVAA